jgi:alkaline phosphatase D
MPVARRPSRGDTIWTERTIGQFATIAILETRTKRCAPGQADEASALLGSEQTLWLDALLGTNSCQWFVLGVSSMITPIWSDRLDDESLTALKTLKLIEPQTGSPFHDLWDSFPTARSHMLDALATATPTPIIVSGDVHIAVEAEARQISFDAAAVTEWVTTSITSQNLDDKMGWKPRTRSRHYEERFTAAVEGIRWCDFDSHGFLLLTLEKDVASCEWWVVETVTRRSNNAFVIHRAQLGR